MISRELALLAVREALRQQRERAREQRALRNQRTMELAKKWANYQANSKRTSG